MNTLACADGVHAKHVMLRSLWERLRCWLACLTSVRHSYTVQMTVEDGRRLCRSSWLLTSWAVSENPTYVLGWNSIKRWFPQTPFQHKGLLKCVRSVIRTIPKDLARTWPFLGRQCRHRCACVWPKLFLFSSPVLHVYVI